MKSYSLYHPSIPKPFNEQPKWHYSGYEFKKKKRKEKLNKIMFPTSCVSEWNQLSQIDFESLLV